MRVVEQLVRSKRGDGTLCEDAICVTRHFAAVFDGATSKSEVEYDGDSPGRFATRVLVDALRHTRPEANLLELLRALTERLAAEYSRYGVLARVRDVPEERAQAVAAIYSRRQRTVWLIGDCQCCVDGVAFSNPNPIDEVLAGTRALVLALEIAAGASPLTLRANDSGRAFILPLLRRQATFQNAPATSAYAHAVIDGFRIEDQLVRTIVLPRTACEVVLASDGYPRLHPTLAESEADLHALLEADPLCMSQHIATKGVRPGDESFDDRAFLRLAVPDA